MKKIKGFTLIELLVVIAIIGILSSVVLASLNVARSKGSDASIKSNLAGIRSQAEIYYDSNGNYGADVVISDCLAAGSIFVDPNVTLAINQASTTSGVAPICLADDGNPTVGTTASSWAVSVAMKQNPADSWCVDSTGYSNIGVATIALDVASCQ